MTLVQGPFIDTLQIENAFIITDTVQNLSVIIIIIIIDTVQMLVLAKEPNG